MHWSDLPVALAPTPGGYDAEGCWSGCAVDNQGVPTLVYSDVFPQVVCLATGSPDLNTWTKYEGNPVIAGPPQDLQGPSGGHFRDPFVWKADGHWQMLMGSKAEGIGGKVLLYRSANLLDWEYAGALLEGDVNQTESFWTGTMWECPNLLDFGRRQALIISVQATPLDHLYAFYVSGRLEGDRFRTEMQDVLVHGGPRGYFYAPQVMRLDDGRYVLWAWIKEGRSEQASIEAGWAGVMSLPLNITMELDGWLCLEPVTELQVLRDDHRRFDSLELPNGTDRLLEGLGGDSLELIAQFEGWGEGEFGLKLRASPDGQEYMRIIVQPVEGRVLIKRDRASLNTDLDRDLCIAPIRRLPNGLVTLHVFLDRSVVEVLINDGLSSVVSRIYPSRTDSLGVGVFSCGGDVKLWSLDVWTMAGIW